jgi:phage-related protein
MGQGLSKIWEGIWSGIGVILVGARDIILNLLTLLVNTFSETWTTFTETIKTMWSDMWIGLGLLVQNAWASLTGSFDELKKNIADWFANLAKNAIDWGKDLIAGFIEGIKSAIGGIGEALKGVGSTVSKAFSGGKTSFMEANAAIYSGNKSAIDKISQEKGVTTSVATEMYKTQINQNITINSPKALSPSDTARENQKASQRLALEF